MGEPGRMEFPTYRWMNGRPTELAPVVGAPVAVAVACVYGLPVHAVVGFAVMAFATGLGITLGFHRLFTHRSFATVRPVEWLLMVLGCMAGQSGPFFWVATHRKHHRHSDHDGDPHSPYVWAGRPLGFWRGFWHAHFGWLRAHGYGYPAAAVADLRRRPDLVWIDRHWFPWYLLGLALPAAAGGLIGGTAYDALIGFLWGGLLRHFAALQVTFAVNSVTHLWGSSPHDTGDQSRNNLLVGVLAFGEGWHNNHHAFPYSARHGLYWWQPDLTWCVIWVMERVRLARRVRRPKVRPTQLPAPQPTVA
ncbi:MAG: acyl-CoA desaturase [Gemmataceae bacterium]|nr:acyl-CoA desaturase [Gemmataceae bacterium]